MTLLFDSIPISNRDYFSITNKISPLQEEIKQFWMIYENEIRWYHYPCYMEKQRGCVILHLDFGEKSHAIISGYTKMIDGVPTIIVNSNEKIYSGRKIFTQMHEIAHVYCHLNRVISSDPLTTKMIEIEANLMASILHISDAALVEVMTRKRQPTILDVCKEFEATFANIFMRLRNYLVYNLNIRANQAQLLAQRFVYQNDGQIFAEFCKA